MIEQMKNPNEYRVWEEGDKNFKLYLKKIRSCKCMEKEDKDYLLHCGIQQRGDNDYIFSRDNDFITKKHAEKRFWLSESAKEQINKAIDEFDSCVSAAENDEIQGINVNDDFSLFCNKVSGEKYDWIVKYTDKTTNKVIYKKYYECDVKNFFFLFRCLRSAEELGQELEKLIFEPTNKNINEHPLVLLARKYNDVKLEMMVKIHFRLADTHDCQVLSDILNLPVLRPLPEEYDKSYVIENNSIEIEGWNLLKRSGYSIAHRPYFSMRGSTHSKISLNPHRKCGIDAAKVDEPAINFDEFLKLFDGKN